MTAFPPLFYPTSNSTGLAKVAMRYLTLPNKAAEWSTEIQNALLKEFSFLADHSLAVSFTSKDENTGHALGHVVVDKKLSIPVFIEKRKLAPLDTFVYKNEPHRLTERRLRKILFRPELFEGLISPDEEKSLAQDEPIHQQTQASFNEGRSVHGSAREFNPVLGLLLSTADRDDLTRFAERVREPELAAKIATSPMLPWIQEILKLELPENHDFLKAAASQLPVHVAQILMEGPGRYTLKLASDVGYAPYVIQVGAEGLRNALASLVDDPQEILAKLAHASSVTLTASSRLTPTAHVAEGFGQAVDCGYGYYGVRTLSGEEKVGWVYPQVYNFDLSPIGQQLFIGEDATAVQEKIAGVAIPEEAAPAPFAGDEIRQGKTGSLVFQTEGYGVALRPFTIESIEQDAGTPILHVKLATGEPLHLHVSSIVTNIEPLRDMPGGYVIPAAAKFAEMKGATQLVGNANELTKAAIETAFADTAVNVRSVGGYFQIRGRPVEGLDELPISELNKDAAAYALAVLGLPGDEAVELVTKLAAANEGSATILDVTRPTPLEQRYQVKESVAVFQKLAVVQSLRKDTLKLASTIEDPEILDRVLGLNFLNPRNIGILVDHIKDLEKTSSRLSELLIASRYGAKTDIDEDAIVTAREAIDDVVEGLATLKSRMGQVTEEA